MHIEEPLPESALLARQLALRWCRPDPQTGENCAWYHGFWQYLRLLKLVTTPEHHAAFYRSALGEAARLPGARRVLVAGAADYGMLAHVIAAFREQGNEPQVTVNDLCETPLRLNQWYAHRVGSDLSVCRCDTLQYAEERPFDVVCTHSFLGRFPPARRLDLTRKWYRLLRPGGLAVTVKRIRPGSGTELSGFTPEQAEAFRDKVRAAARSLSTPGIAPEDLAENARVYADRNSTWPLRSREEIVELFERASFRVDRLDCTPVASASSVGASGPTALGGAEYVQIVATRV
ncbi:MAG TPA: class I SAM-dependent methyltransferase [Burkholderiales bacterium]|nr:class I SAM-dependent methyltransferase [Burkholderiales bacterium]